MRRVISLWLPRFPTDRLCRRQPGWRSEPLVTVSDGRGMGQAGPIGGRADGGGTVMRIAAASRAAEAAAGIVPGMPLSDARARLPDLRVVPADPEADARALDGLADWCGRYTPWVALDAAGLGDAVGARHGLWLDVTGCAHLFDGEQALLDDLVGRLVRFGYAARAGLADTPGAAWAVAHYGGAKRSRVIHAGGARKALAKLPVAALRLAGAEAEGLERVGLRRIGDLYDMPRGALARRFGAQVVRRLDQALGRVPEPISPRRPATPHRVRQAFAEPIASLEAIAAAARRLLGVLETRLETAGQGVRRLALELYRVDGGVLRVELGVSAPVRDAKHLMRLLAERLDGLDVGFGIDVVALDAPVTAPLPAAQPALDGLSAAPATADLFAPEAEGAADLARLIDRLGNRFGLENVRRFSPRQSHLPERAVASVAATGASEAWDWPKAKRRPARLLVRPEPIEAVAMVPDAPPVVFRWRRGTHRVVKADGPERIAAEWWRTGRRDKADDTADEGAIRDYYRVEDAEGRRFWLYREGLYRPGVQPGWFVHGIFA